MVATWISSLLDEGEQKSYPSEDELEAGVVTERSFTCWWRTRRKKLGLSARSSLEEIDKHLWQWTKRGTQGMKHQKGESSTTKGILNLHSWALSSVRLWSLVQLAPVSLRYCSAAAEQQPMDWQVVWTLWRHHPRDPEGNCESDLW